MTINTTIPHQLGKPLFEKWSLYLATACWGVGGQCVCKRMPRWYNDEDDDDKDDKGDNDDENEMAYAWLAGLLQGAPVKMIGRRTAGDKPLHCILSKQMLYDKMNNTSLYYWMLSINF